VNDDLKEQVKARVDLSDWIARDGVPLKGGPNEWKACCPFHMEKTPSFNVVRKDGGWFFYCHGCQAQGDVFEWVMRRKGLDFPQALRLVANDVGMAVPLGREERLYQPAARVPEKARPPVDPDRYKPITEGCKVWAYLVEQRRLEPGLFLDYGVGQTRDGEAYAFAYRWRPAHWPAERAPRFEFCKVVKVDRVDGKKEEWRDPAGGKNVLFGMSAPQVELEHKRKGELVICEGEIDALSWAGYGWAAVSVPGGAKYTGWIDLCYEWLQAFSKLHISFDEDNAGRMKVEEIVKRLGIARADIVRLPEREEGVRYKDINECLQAGVSAEVIRECVLRPEFIQPPKLKTAADFEEEIWQKFHPTGKDQIGLTLPWGNYHGSSLPFRFRYGEVTVWTGYNKHGKSEVLNHCVVDLCLAQGERAVICSLEVQAPETYRKLIRMALGRRNVCAVDQREHFYERCLVPLLDRVWAYDHVGYAPLEDVMNVLLYAFQRYGCRQFVLDSLMQFEGLDGEGQDQWNSQRDFMQALDTFAKTYGVHVHLVAHSRKPDKGGEGNIPRRYNIMGSAYISNKPSNVIVVWRNRKKQDRLEEIFQYASEKWVAKYEGEKLPPWKRLLGGKPAPGLPEEHRQTWLRMVGVIEGLPNDMGAEFQKLVAEHDAYLIVDAQRGGDGDTPARHLWFHYDSLQFLEVSPWQEKDTRRHPVVYAQQTKGEEE